MFCFSLWVGFDALNNSGPRSILFSEGKNVVCLRSTHSHCCRVQALSPVWLFVIPWAAACQVSLSFTVSQNLFRLMSIESVMLSNHFILCRPLLLLPSIFSSIRVFYSESAFHIRWPKYWRFSFNIVLPMNIQDSFPLGLTGLISLLSKGLSGIFSSTTIQKHQFFSPQSSLWSNSHIHT